MKRSTRHPFAQRHRQHLLSLPAIAWLVLALVWAPALGRWHQVAHAVPLEHRHAPGESFLADHTRADCLLLDQLALGDAPPGATPLALPMPAPMQALPTHRAQRTLVQRATPFQARAPPWHSPETLLIS